MTHICFASIYRGAHHTGDGRMGCRKRATPYSTFIAFVFRSPRIYLVKSGFRAFYFFCSTVKARVVVQISMDFN